jgi:hypothetical protein
MTLVDPGITDTEFFDDKPPTGHCATRTSPARSSTP